MANSHETFGIAEGFEVKGIVSFGYYGLPMVGRHEYFELCKNKLAWLNFSTPFPNQNIILCNTIVETMKSLHWKDVNS